MRQAGLKPKSHSSGTYWVRANASNKKKRNSVQPKAEEKPVYDSTGDGKTDLMGILLYAPVNCPWWFVWLVIVMSGVVWILW
jgi:hypothetical protein